MPKLRRSTGNWKYRNLSGNDQSSIPGGEGKITTLKPKQNGSDFYDAQATLYRDLSTVLAIIFGFLGVALAVGSVNTNPSSLESIMHQHPILFPATVFLGVLLLMVGSMMVYSDKKIIAIKRSTTRK